MRRICIDQDLRSFFKDGKPHSIKEIEDHFEISRVVAYREMKRLNALLAVNKTGHFILSGSKRFDQNGFLKVDDMLFFSGGTLSDALISLVSKSHSGMKLKELQKVVCTNVNVQLLNLVKRNKLYRHKFAGGYYYFSMDKETRTRQLEVRERQFSKLDQRLILEQAQRIPLELVVRSNSKR